MNWIHSYDEKGSWIQKAKQLFRGTSPRVQGGKAGPELKEIILNAELPPAEFSAQVVRKALSHALTNEDDKVALINMDRD